ncbi:Uncharacterised protein [Chlamydia trachomatis]|nr:Uncharacterised protein [Chlamydia trachomatis]
MSLYFPFSLSLYMKIQRSYWDLKHHEVSLAFPLRSGFLLLLPYF